MKKAFIMFICGAFCLLSACVGQEAKEASSDLADSGDAGKESGEKERMAAYAAALKGICVDRVLPDGQELSFDDTLFEMAENQFAVFDIDSDGEKELLLTYTTTDMAGMMELIYDYDEEAGEVREEFWEFPALTFYENGVIEAGWSHNQGLAGDFWPYTLYQYDPGMDSYLPKGMVDAWDRSLSEVNYEGRAFPEEIDQDGDGVVYYIMKNGEAYNTDAPVDGAQYQEWRDAYLNGAKEIEVPFVELTEENIGQVR